MSTVRNFLSNHKLRVKCDECDGKQRKKIGKNILSKIWMLVEQKKILSEREYWESKEREGEGKNSLDLRKYKLWDEELL